MNMSPEWSSQFAIPCGDGVAAPYFPLEGGPVLCAYDVLQNSTGDGYARCIVGGYSEAAGRARSINSAPDLDTLHDLHAAAYRAWCRGDITDHEREALAELVARRFEALMAAVETIETSEARAA